MIKSQRYTDNQLRWLRKLFENEVKSIRSDVVVAKKNYDAETKKSNEFRQTLKDQAARLATREELKELRDQMSKTPTRGELWSAVVAMIAIVLGIMAYMK